MNYFEKLRDLFPYHWEVSINQVINDVNEEMPTGDNNEKLERMCILLIENFSNESTDYIPENNDYMDGAGTNVLLCQILRRFPDACEKYVEDLLNGNQIAFDYTHIVNHFMINGYVKKGGSNSASNSNDDKELKANIRQIYPDACEDYVAKCVLNGLKLEDIIDKFSNEGYITSNNTRSTAKINEIHQKLCDMLPKFDPDFLLKKAQKLESSNNTAINQCIDNLLGMETFPTIEEYNKRQSKRKQMLNYVFNFKIDDFLNEFSYSLDGFENERVHSLQNESNKIELEQDKRFAEVILHHVYKNDRKAEFIDSELKRWNYDIIKCCGKLGAKSKVHLKENEVDLPQNSYNNKLLFQELAYVIYRPLINNYKMLRQRAYDQNYQEAKEKNLLQTCMCCFDDGLLLLPDECYMCKNGCVFCKQCMITGCEVAYGEGLLEINCFANCGEQFSDGTLFFVMNKVAFCKLMQRKQIKEIKDAQVDGFETCPFCDFATEVDKNDKIFKCQNYDCGKESCRECRHEAHIPLRCTEIEYDEDVKMRIFIESQMTAALLRTCKNCSKQFIKESGCNKMTCQCGTTMCYVCGASRIDYNHFIQTGCPQQSDQEQLHRSNVLRGIQRAKVELGIDRNPNKLKFDPAKGF